MADFKLQDVPVSVFDKIRSMTDDELKDFICSVCLEGCLALRKLEVCDNV